HDPLTAARNLQATRPPGNVAHVESAPRTTDSKDFRHPHCPRSGALFTSGTLHRPQPRMKRQGYWPNDRSRLIYRLRLYRGRKGETKAFTWTEYRDLLLAAHRQLPGGNIVLIWDNLNIHLKAGLRAFTDAQA